MTDTSPGIQLRCEISLPHMKHGTCPGRPGQQVAESGRIDGIPQLILPGPIPPKDEVAGDPDA